MPPPVPPPPSVVPSAQQPGPIGKPRSVGLVILLSIVTFGIWTVVWSYQNGEELKQYTRTGIGGVGYLFITMLLMPATMFLMAAEVEQLYVSEGEKSPVSAMTGLWFLLPIIGNIVWYVKMQHALNGYWVAHGSTASPGL